MLGRLIELILRLAMPFFSVIKKRYEFEKRNEDFLALNCSVWFHVSSEGELEQIYPILHYVLSQKRPTLLLITSKSVEKKAILLSEQYDHLLVRRFSVICEPSRLNKLTQPKLFFMVRYDFFPRLLRIAHSPHTKSYLINASLKNKATTFMSRWWTRFVYAQFDTIFWASDLEIKRAYKLGLNSKGLAVDLRNERIIERQRSLTLEKSCFIKKLSKEYPKEKRVILGSLWPKTSQIFFEELKDLKKRGYLIVIAPHHLKGDEFEQIYSCLKNEATLLDNLEDTSLLSGDGEIVICQVPGILCELYSYFRHCYVDGGFARSVHSLSEPFWGGGHVYCGPKIRRSTEFDMIKVMAPRHIKILDDIKLLKDAIINQENELDDLEVLRENVFLKKKEYLALIDEDLGKLL